MYKFIVSNEIQSIILVIQTDIIEQKTYYKSLNATDRNKTLLMYFASKT